MPRIHSAHLRLNLRRQRGDFAATALVRQFATRTRHSPAGTEHATAEYSNAYVWGTLTLHGELTNALDRRNPCCTDLEYSSIDGTPTLDRELRHWLPLVPSIGVLWKY